MGHIHASIDYVVSIFIANRTTKRVLLVDHKKLGGWYPVGGHVELTETTDEALIRETKEETGLLIPKDVHIVQDYNTLQRMEAWENFKSNPQHAKQLFKPWAVEIHDFPPVPGHRHLALVYYGLTDVTYVELDKEAHNSIRWFDQEDLNDPHYKITESVKWYAHTAISATKRMLEGPVVGYASVA